MIYVDAPRWAAHGTLFAHLVSDESLDELRAFADAVGLDPRAWDGDHYDVPQHRYDDVVRAGAAVVDGRTLVRLLDASGLRFRKRRGERPLAALHDVVPGVAAGHRLHLVRSSLPAPEPVAVVAVAVHAPGVLLLVRPRRRGGWGAPGGAREPGEDAVDAARREVREEAGVGVGALEPIGYERLLVGAEPPVHVQVYATTLPAAVPLRPRAGEILHAEWVPYPQVPGRCANAFWWPLLRDHLDRAGAR